MARKKSASTVDPRPTGAHQQRSGRVTPDALNQPLIARSLSGARAPSRRLWAHQDDRAHITEETRRLDVLDEEACDDDGRRAVLVRTTAVEGTFERSRRAA